MKEFRGIGVALVTPFLEDGSVDFEGVDRLLSFTGEALDYYVVMGTTGESATLNNREKEAVLRHVVAHSRGGLPVVYGIGGNNTAQVTDMIRATNLEGVSAILSVSPYYNKPSQAGIIAHYRAIADASPLPLILYNVPGRTMSNLTANTTITLSEHPNIIGIKEASGDLNQIQEIFEGASNGFFITSGDDLLTPDIIRIGGIGVISVLANGFPKQFSAITQAALAGNFERSQALKSPFKTINPLIYQESNPVGIKEVLRQKGICGNQVRLPLLKATTSLSSRLAQILDEYQNDLRIQIT